MFEDFIKRITQGFGGTMFLISLPVVMLVAGLMCYTAAGRIGLPDDAYRMAFGGAVIAGVIFAWNWNGFLDPQSKKKTKK